jgi:hypothetical protein
MRANVDLDAGARGPSWLDLAVGLIALGKFVQHIVMTAALYLNSGDIRLTVVVNPDLLMGVTAVVGVLFAIGLCAMLASRPGAANLLIALALLDIFDEFVAHGGRLPVVTVSWLVAIALLILALVDRRRLRAQIALGDRGPGRVALQ